MVLLPSVWVECSLLEVSEDNEGYSNLVSELSVMPESRLALKFSLDTYLTLYDTSIHNACAQSEPQHLSQITITVEDALSLSSGVFGGLGTSNCAWDLVYAAGY